MQGKPLHSVSTLRSVMGRIYNFIIHTAGQSILIGETESDVTWPAVQ